ncbi:MAG TPA: hypothetical protein VKR53_17185 [Puia sp.]|nr:hypothetical protein [Puia sp.]
MKSLFSFLFLSLVIYHLSFSQSAREDIYTNVVLYQKRTELEKDLRERIIAKTFSGPLDSNTEYKYETACEAISQFQFASQEVEQGFANLFERYDSLDYETKKSFIEAVYAVHPKKYIADIQKILDKETNPKLFAMCAVYLFRSDPSISNSNHLKINLVEEFPGYDSVNILQELVNYLSYHLQQIRHSTPDIVQLFKYQKKTGQKTIYSFQRWNRDYPGIAVVQNANGRFARDADGRLLIFQQLARSGSDLPYFITNGSTPQGVYSIQGTEISHNNFIGPTPNIQLIIPFEDKWEKYFHEDAWNTTNDSLQMYLHLLPTTWRNYLPMMEVWNAGKIGRTEIIAHGTTIDPEYFKDKPYYPLTPTEGCLCAKELWNMTTGHLLLSEQFNLVSAFQSTTGNKGLLYVVNVDDQQTAITRDQVESWVRKFERK